jgi:HK97 family phage major capsid protein
MSDQIVVSKQLAQDCGAPNIAAMLRDVFAQRISLGLGGQFVSTLLSNAHVAETTAASNAITPSEIISMLTGVSNAAYAYKPTSGWLMNADTPRIHPKLRYCLLSVPSR